MASSVKTSMSSHFYADDKAKKIKKSEDTMGSDDFYKQASAEFARDTIVKKQTQDQASEETLAPEGSVENENIPAPVDENVVMTEGTEVEKSDDVSGDLLPPESSLVKEQTSTVALPPEPATLSVPEPVEDIVDDFGDDFDDFDFVDHYGEDTLDDISKLLPENTAKSAIKCAFVGVGGGWW